MRLTKITARHVKGGDFSFNLSAAMVFTGDNDAGKSRILDAVQLAIVGYVPSLGKTNAATFQLADGPEMIVEAEITDGVVVYALRRRWYLSGNSVKTEFSIPDALLTRLGSADLAVMLNANEYFALGPTDRIRYVAEHCPAPRIANAELLLRACKVLPVETGDNPPARVTQLKDASKPFYSGDAREFVDKLGAAVNALFKSAKDHGERMERTVQGISNLRANDEPAAPVRSADEILSERAKLERESTTLSEEKGRLIAAFSAMKASNIRREQIRRDLAAMSKDLAGLPDLPDLRFKRGQIDTKLAAAGQPVTDLEVTNAVFMLNSKLDEAKTLRRLGTEETSKQLTCEREESAVAKETKCPYCGATGDGWKVLKLAELAAARVAHKRLADQHASGLPGLDQIIARLTTEHRTLVDRRQLITQLKDAGTQTDQAIARLLPMEAKTEALKAELAALMPDDPELSATVETIQAKINTLNDEARALDQESSDVAAVAQDKTRLAQAETDRDRAREDQAAWDLVGKELKKAQAELVEAAFKPLLKLANDVFPGLLKSPLAFRDGEIGRWEGGTWVSHKVFGGAASKLTFTAIQGALSASCPIKIMLLDELGVFSAKTAIKVANAVEAAIEAGRLDQFIGADPDRGDLYAVKDSAFQVVEIK